MAVNARNEGHLDYAHRFMQRASEILNHPTTLERLGTQSGEKIAAHSEPKADREKKLGGWVRRFRQRISRNNGRRSMSATSRRTRRQPIKADKPYNLASSSP
jgi:hypothetical protein